MEGGACQCQGGNVFYGLLEVDGMSPAGFDEMYGDSFAVKYNVSGTIDCTEKAFGVDPQPGKAKQCFCDDIQQEDEESIEAELAYWREQREITTMQTRSEESYTTYRTTTTTATTIGEETQKRIAEEEERFTAETEKRLKEEEDERQRLKEAADQKDKVEHESELALDADAHKEEMEAQAAAQAAHEAEVEAENARKDAENADELAKHKAQLAA